MSVFYTEPKPEPDLAPRRVPTRAKRPIVRPQLFSKKDFCDAYERELKARFAWATESPERLATFMREVRFFLRVKPSKWSPGGDAAWAAWKTLGGKGKPTALSLRALNGRGLDEPDEA